MVTTHLMFLQYMLQEGALYLPWSRARDIWGTLIASPEACEWDREVLIISIVIQNQLRLRDIC